MLLHAAIFVAVVTFSTPSHAQIYATQLFPHLVAHAYDSKLYSSSTSVITWLRRVCFGRVFTRECIIYGAIRKWEALEKCQKKIRNINVYLNKNSGAAIFLPLPITLVAFVFASLWRINLCQVFINQILVVSCLSSQLCLQTVQLSIFYSLKYNIYLDVMHINNSNNMCT